MNVRLPVQEVVITFSANVNTRLFLARYRMLLRCSTPGHGFFLKQNTTNDFYYTRIGKAPPKIWQHKKQKHFKGSRLLSEEQLKRSNGAKSYVVGRRRRRKVVDWLDQAEQEAPEGHQVCGEVEVV